MTSTFDQDKITGEQIEQMVIDKLPNYGFIKELDEKKKYFYDLTDKEGKRYEVKFDSMAKETGNVFFECFYKEKRSGILKTTAEYLIYVFKVRGNYEMYKSKIFPLQYAIVENKLKLVEGGNNKAVLGILIKADIFKQLSCVDKIYG